MKVGHLFGPALSVGQSDDEAAQLRPQVVDQHTRSRLLPSFRSWAVRIRRDSQMGTRLPVAELSGLCPEPITPNVNRFTNRPDLIGLLT
jgi:hypothetical protein